MSSIATFMREGGWGMWPILLLGLLTLGSAARYAARPVAHTVGFIAALWVAIASVVGHAVLTDVATVFRVVASEEVTDAQLTRVLLIGLMESTRPAALGAFFLTLIPLLVAVGLWRARPAS
jgi:hypothetical protein